MSYFFFFFILLESMPGFVSVVAFSSFFFLLSSFFFLLSFAYFLTLGSLALLLFFLFFFGVFLTFSSFFFRTTDADDGTTYRVKTYFAAQFHALRRALLSCYEEREQQSTTNTNTFEAASSERLFIQSMSQCKPWAANGGKSNSSFCKTLDNRFVVKCVTNHEFDMFLDVAGLYFQHMAQQHSALVQILGAYQIVTHTPKKIRRGSVSGSQNSGPKTSSRSSTRTQCVVVMGNVFYGASMKGMEVFDLKGKLRYCSREKLLGMEMEEQKRQHRVRAEWKSWRSGPRVEPPPEKMSEHPMKPVRFDGDLMSLTRGLPVPLKESDMNDLRRRVDSDGDFFLIGEAVDYSLLAGVDVKRHTITVGIVDYMHSYDLLKRIEFLGKNMVSDSTIKPPPLYYQRFSEGLDKYFLPVPEEEEEGEEEEEEKEVETV